MKRLLIALTLTCVLSFTALAGDIPMTGPTPCAPADIPSTDCAAPGDGHATDAPCLSGDMGNGSALLIILDLLF
jgi:hypothetical protein